MLYEYIAYGMFIGVPTLIAVILAVNYVPPVKRWYQRRRKRDTNE